MTTIKERYEIMRSMIKEIESHLQDLLATQEEINQVFKELPQYDLQGLYIWLKEQIEAPASVERKIDVTKEVHRNLYNYEFNVNDIQYGIEQMKLSLTEIQKLVEAILTELKELTKIKSKTMRLYL
jgi:ribosomal protein L16 Arg81 hydroxylase